MFVKLILVVYFLLVVPVVSYGDLGFPDVQAVCKVELKNGGIIEGVILIARGGYGRHCDTNGFYLKVEGQPERVRLFDIYFNAIQPYKGVVEKYPSSRSKWGHFKDPKVYYLRDITSEHYRTFKEEEVIVKKDTLDSSIILKRDIVHHVVYELIEYIPIFPKVPKELYLRRAKSIKPLHVDIREVERFELVIEPPQKWIDQISSVIQARTEEAKALEKKYPDYMNESLPPEWFHELVKYSKKRYKEIYGNLFKPWHF